MRQLKLDATHTDVGRKKGRLSAPYFYWEESMSYIVKFFNRHRKGDASA